MVPSPEPQAIVEREEIAGLVEGGALVICAGGGGVPLVRNDGLVGVEAVVDKDKTSAMLASEIGAETLVILTDVDAAYLDYGTPEQQPIEAVTVETLRQHLAAGEFGEGTMQPKIEACCRAVEHGCPRAVISSPERLQDAIEGAAGTQVTG